MKTLFTAEANSKGGRSGTIQTPDGLVALGNPLEKGIEKRGPNPELLFAGAHSACYHGALCNAAKKLGTPVEDSTVRALVSLIEEDQGGYRLAVELHGQLPGMDRAQAQRIMDEAHKTCPYSKARRGGTSVNQRRLEPHQGQAETEALRERDIAPRHRKPMNKFVYTGQWGHPMPIWQNRLGKPELFHGDRHWASNLSALWTYVRNA